MSDQRIADHRHGDVVRLLTDELTARHRGEFSHAEVQEVVRSAYDELSREARVTAYLRVLTRTRAEKRLAEMARRRHGSAASALP